MCHPRPPYRDRAGCAPLGRQQWAWQTERKVSAGFAELSPCRGKVRGESAAPGTARPSPEVPEPCLCPGGHSSRKWWGRSLQLSSRGMSGIAQHEAGDLTGQPRSLEWQRAAGLRALLQRLPPWGWGRAGFGAEGATSWPGRAALVAKGSGDSCEAFGSCRSNLQPLLVEGLVLEGAFQNFGKAGSNWSCLGGVSPLVKCHEVLGAQNSQQQSCSQTPLWAESAVAWLPHPLWKSWLWSLVMFANMCIFRSSLEFN